MKVKLNFYSFILSLICIVLFFLATSSSIIVNFTINLLQVHPLFIVMLLCIVTLILGLIGLSAATSQVLLIRGLLTVIINIILLGSITYILVLGNLFKFT